MTQTHSHKSTNGKPHHLTAREAENVAAAIDALIRARIEHMTNPGQGGDVAEKCHGDLTEELKRLMSG